MADNDFVQKSLVSVFKYSIAATVLTVNFQRGAGVLTRTGVGTLRVTYPSGKGIDTLRTFAQGRSTGTVMATVQYDVAASTDEVKDFRVFDNAGVAVDNLPGEIEIYVVQGG